MGTRGQRGLCGLGLWLLRASVSPCQVAAPADSLQRPCDTLPRAHRRGHLRKECEKQLGSLQDENASPPARRSAGPGDGERGTRFLPSVLPEETVGCYKLLWQLRLQGQLWPGSWKPGRWVARRGPRAAQSGWHPPAEPRVAGLLAALPAAGCAQAPCPVCRHSQE